MGNAALISCRNLSSYRCVSFVVGCRDIANLQKMAVAERRQAEPTTQHTNEVGLAVRQATIVVLVESCRQ